MKFHFTGISKVVYDHDGQSPKSEHVLTDFRLEISNNLDHKVYLNKGLPTKEAIKPLSQCFIQGLIGNIHKAHDKGWWDSAEHLRYVIDELERGFVQITKVGEGTM